MQPWQPLNLETAGSNPIGGSVLLGKLTEIDDGRIFSLMGTLNLSTQARSGHDPWSLVFIMVKFVVHA